MNINLSQNKFRRYFITALVLGLLCLQSHAQVVRVVGNKGTINEVGNNSVTTALTAPTTPVEGDVWFDTTTNTTKIWDADANEWKLINTWLGYKTIHHTTSVPLGITNVLHNNTDIHIEGTGGVSLVSTAVNDGTNFYITNTTGLDKTLTFSGFTGAFLRNGGAEVNAQGTGLVLKSNTRYLCHVTENSGFYFNATPSGGGGDITSTDLTITGGTDAALNDVTLEIATDAVTATELATSAVTADEILNETILSEDIKNGEVKTLDIADANVTTAKIAPGSTNQTLVTNGTGTVSWVNSPSEASITEWVNNTNGGSYSTNDLISYNGVIYKNLTGVNADTLPDADFTNWKSTGGGDIVPLWKSDTNGGSYSTNDIINYRGVLYKNLTGTNTNTTPNSDATNWKSTGGGDIVPLWKSDTNGGSYGTNDIINYNGALYKNLTGTNTDTAPSLDTTNWIETNLVFKEKSVEETLTDIVDVDATHATFKMDLEDGEVNASVETTSSYNDAYSIDSAFSGGDHATAGQATETVTITFDRAIVISKLRGKGRPSNTEYFKDIELKLYDVNDALITTKNTSVSEGAEYFEFKNDKEIKKLEIIGTNRVGSNPGLNAFEFYTVEKQIDYAVIPINNNSLILNTDGKTQVKAEDVIKFITNGEERARILNNGNVGIGTTSPSESTLR